MYRTLGGKEQMMVYNEESTNEVHTIQVSIEERKEVVTNEGGVLQFGRDGTEN